MLASVQLRLPDGATVTVGPGAVVGRAFTADVRIDDGRVSEAHAMVSLRGGELVLFALRGRVRVDGRDMTRVTLTAGLVVELAPGVLLSIAHVELPDAVLALEGPGVPRQMLVGTTSVLLAPTLHLVTGVDEQAAAVVWSDGVRWRVRVGEGPVRTLAVGDEVTVAGLALRAVEEPVARLGVPDTAPRSTLGGRLRIISLFDSVQLWREGEPAPCLLKGQQARLFAELLSVGGPMRWEALAGQLWPSDTDVELLRHRLDVTLSKLRQRLAAVGIRRDLVTSHRNGQLEVLLYPGDQAEDRS
jgi:hypothetical protein